MLMTVPPAHSRWLTHSACQTPQMGEQQTIVPRSSIRLTRFRSPSTTVQTKGLTYWVCVICAAIPRRHVRRRRLSPFASCLPLLRTRCVCAYIDRANRCSVDSSSERAVRFSGCELSLRRSRARGQAIAARIRENDAPARLLRFAERRYWTRISKWRAFWTVGAVRRVVYRAAEVLARGRGKMTRVWLRI